MRNLILFIFIVTLFKCDNRIKYSEILIIPEKIDLGKIKLGSTNNINLIIHNPSSNDLNILGVKPSCDCSITKEKTITILKKSIDTIGITYKPTEIGKHIENITIKSNTNPPFNDFLIVSEVIK